jgi:hypothetical protein
LDRYAHTDIPANCNEHSHSDCNNYSNKYRCANSDLHGHFHTDVYSHIDPNIDAYSNAYSNGKCYSI